MTVFACSALSMAVDMVSLLSAPEKLQGTLNVAASTDF